MAAQVQQIVRDDEFPGGPTFYDYGPLEFSTRVFGKYWRSWRLLKDGVKFRARFCGADTRAILDGLVGDMKKFCKGAAIRCLFSWREDLAG